tara:strand:+ start:1125 stop:1652 length:528 start_codon:yes stop_codon:yes gene_type:complete
MSVYKKDGIGTRKDGAGGEVANVSQGNARFVRLYAIETIAKGACVAWDINSAIDGTDSTDYGYGNIVANANSGTATQRQVIGVAAEAVTMSSDDVTNKAWKSILIQVSGRCDFVISTSGQTVGLGQVASSTDGRCEDYADGGSGDVDIPFGILCVDASGTGTADATVLLTNPCNL